MAYNTLYNFEPCRLTFYFDNNLNYTVDYTFSGGVGDNFIYTIDTIERDANSNENPIGTISSDSLYVSVFDSANNLMPTNKTSPYYGFMRNGVKMVFEIAYDGVHYEKYGTYYVNSWKTAFNRMANIGAYDRLQYITNQELPKLKAYSGVRMKQLITNVFTGIGLDASEFSIDNSLDIQMVYGVTKGTTVRSFLDDALNALNARIIIKSDGIIRIVPALSAYGQTTWTLTDAGLKDSIDTAQNTSNIYNKVRVNYKKTGSYTNDNLLSNSGIILKTGVNKFDNLKFSNKNLGLVDVSVDYPPTVLDKNGNSVAVDIKWDYSVTYVAAYQDGIDITVVNNTGVEVTDFEIYVNGAKLNTTDAYEETDIPDTDTKVANVLQINSNATQDSATAKAVANSISRRLNSTNKRVVVNTLLSAKVQKGDIVILNLGYSEFDGRYKILDCDTTWTDYTKTITLVEYDPAVWKDIINWTDSDTWKDF